MRDMLHRIAILCLLVATALVVVPSAAAPAPPQKGGFRVQFVPGDTPEYDAIREGFQANGGYEELVAEINASLALPVDILISFQNGDGPLYDASQHAIVMNYEFADLVATLFLQEEPELTDEELWDSVFDVFDFVLFHEVGHALVDVLELPVVGREEDAVDSLGAVLAAELLGDPELSVGAAITFDMLAAQSDEITDEEFWDEHSLGEQRYYSILCWAYGADTETMAYLIEEEWLPADRADRCVADYAQQANSWLQLLQPALRE